MQEIAREGEKIAQTKVEVKNRKRVIAEVRIQSHGVVDKPACRRPRGRRTIEKRVAPTKGSVPSSSQTLQERAATAKEGEQRKLIDGDKEFEVRTETVTEHQTEWIQATFPIGIMKSGASTTSPLPRTSWEPRGREQCRYRDSRDENMH